MRRSCSIASAGSRGERFEKVTEREPFAFTWERPGEGPSLVDLHLA